jgi:hypothetical protein
MILRTFYNRLGGVTRVVYELPRHEHVQKDTKMRLLEKDGSWYVLAETRGSSRHMRLMDEPISYGSK